jgi:hypothetical protein
VRAAYADPPYIGQAKRHYDCAEIDHTELVARLGTYDAWALSCSSPTLREILAMCPADVRVASWVKPFASFKPGVNPAYTWEPVIFHSTSKRERRAAATVKDHVIASITMRRGLSGAKPRAFCFWLFDLLGLESTDTLDDLFPGTGVVGDCWLEFCARPKVNVCGRLV